MKKLLTVLSFGFFFLSCEKDDLCDANTPTTPKLVLEFFDASTNVAKNVSNLKVIADGSPEGIIFTTATDATKYLANGVSTIKIPLKTSADLTKYRMIMNFGRTTAPLSNEDIIEFKYVRNELYLSRACGYKTLFELTSLPIRTDAVTPDGLWIQNITVSQPKIDTENETHIKIYFN